jgi:hypothetical protein
MQAFAFGQAFDLRLYGFFCHAVSLLKGNFGNTTQAYAFGARYVLARTYKIPNKFRKNIEPVITGPIGFICFMAAPRAGLFLLSALAGGNRITLAG